MTKRIVRFEVGMRVTTPCGHVARVDGIAQSGEADMYTRIDLTYFDAHMGSVKLQGKLLRPYEGPLIAFPDEIERARKINGDEPLLTRPTRRSV